LSLADIAAQFAGGSGTHVDPYHISTVQKFQESPNHPDKHFVLINDIDVSETTHNKPIRCNLGDHFSGIHINGHIISHGNMALDECGIYRYSAFTVPHFPDLG
jgi:hypothetical protein